jgi:hypothetical protein
MILYWVKSIIPDKMTDFNRADIVVIKRTKQLL